MLIIIMLLIIIIITSKFGMYLHLHSTLGIFPHQMRNHVKGINKIGQIWHKVPQKVVYKSLPPTSTPNTAGFMVRYIDDINCIASF